MEEREYSDEKRGGLQNFSTLFPPQNNGIYHNGQRGKRRDLVGEGRLSPAIVDIVDSLIHPIYIHGHT